MNQDNAIHYMMAFEKPDCSSKIRDGNMGLSLFTMTLVMILYMTLHRSMGLYFPGESAPSLFGMRVRKVALKVGRIFLDV